MNKQETITQKVNELSEAVRACKGSVMVIGVAPTENENESAIIVSLRGNSHAVSGSIAKVMISKSGGVINGIIKEGVALSYVMAMAGVKADKEEVVEKEFND